MIVFYKSAFVFLLIIYIHAIDGLKGMHHAMSDLKIKFCRVLKMNINELFTESVGQMIGSSSIKLKDKKILSIGYSFTLYISIY